MNEKQSLANFVERAYLDYSMYVVLDRALPHIADGFKPVQRRIVYAMSELGLSYTSKHKKAARTVGDVLGKFHPHGDSACYEAMVLMAQPFSYRYPLVDGQGNWGAMDDPKSFAAMRYTEARLTHYAQCFLREVQMGTVEWIPNFDGALLEPKTLPARLPNVLLNGAMGIAVGIATDIPPHNVAEVVDACCLLLDEPHSQLDDLLKCIQGPDFPCGGQLINSASQLREIYATGKGILRLRARYQVDDHEPIIRIIELPYQVSINRVMEQVSGQIEAKKLPQIIDIRDESDQQNPVMLVLVLRNKRVDCDAIMNHLFASTDLEKNQRCNLTLIGTDNRPRTMDLHSLLVQWLNYRRDTLQKRLTHRIEKVLQRLHILDGLLIAFLSIDEVIAIIRTEDDPKHRLMMRFALSDEQAEAILQLRLRYIAKLEEIQLRAEQDQLNDERYFLETHLHSSTKLDALLRSELVEDTNTFADKRRTFIQPASDAKAFDEEQAITKEAVTVVLSKQGWIRSARGHEIDPNNLSYKSSDSLWRSVRTYTNEQLVIIDRTGRSYSIGVHQLPSARGQGEPLSSKLEITDLADIPILCAHPKDQHELLVNNKGYGFIVTNKELRSRNKAGKAVIKLDDNAQIFAMLPCQLQDAPLVALITTSGYLLIIALAEVPQLARGKGVKLINIPPKAAKQGETLAGVCICRKSESLRIGAGKRHYTITPDNWQGYISARAKRGKRLPVGLQNPNNISVVA